MLTLEQSAIKWPFNAGGGGVRLLRLPLATGLHGDVVCIASF